MRCVRIGKRELAVRVASRRNANWGYPRTGEWYRDLTVEHDGTVLAWDDVSMTWTRCHSIPEETIEAARRFLGDR